MSENPSPRFLYWDSCVFIDYFERTPSRIKTLDDIWSEIEADKESRIFTSILTTVETAYRAEEKNRRRLDANTVQVLDALWRDTSVLVVVELDPIIASTARELMRAAVVKGWSLKPNDAVHLATAQRLKTLRQVQEFHTFDSAIFKYSELIGMEIREPYAQQPRLDLDEPA